MRIQRIEVRSATFSSWDDHASSVLYQAGTQVPRFVWKILEYTGDGVVWLLLTISAILAPATSSSWRWIFCNLLAGLLIDLVEVGTIKGLVRRPRPKHNTLAKDMVVIVAVDHYSFPSGHSSRYEVLLLAGPRSRNEMQHITDQSRTYTHTYSPCRVSFIAIFVAILQWSEPSPLAHAYAVYVACVWALTVAFSRCVMGRHYLTDVIAGLVLGIITVCILTKVRSCWVVGLCDRDDIN